MLDSRALPSRHSVRRTDQCDVAKAIKSARGFWAGTQHTLAEDARDSALETALEVDLNTTTVPWAEPYRYTGSRDRVPRPPQYHLPWVRHIPATGV